MNPCPCGGKPIVRRPGAVAAHLKHEPTILKFSVVCSMSSSRHKKCNRRTGLHPSKAEAVAAWEAL